MGKETLALVNDMIPGILKFKVDNNIKQDVNKVENKSSITADFIPNDDNGYTVDLKVTDNNTTIFDLKVYAGSREQAQKIMDNWTKNAEDLYPNILGLISK